MFPMGTQVVDKKIVMKTSSNWEKDAFSAGPNSNLLYINACRPSISISLQIDLLGWIAKDGGG